ncbi:MAG: hypothetical protein LBH07_03555, partial [Treponema sp.]|jgi:hypothetical protein|nr:hypothetical protein [Treponema sp.]
LVTLTSAAYAADGTAGIEKIIITMETPDVGSSGGGLCRLLVNIPVIAIDTGANGLTWYIRGGLNNLAPDGGKGTTAPSVVLPSTGGAIILGIGVTAMNIIVSGP